MPMPTNRCDINPHILQYIELVESKEYLVCKEQLAICRLVVQAFESEDIYCDNEQLEKYLSLQKYFPFRLFPWEVFCFALHNCVYRADGRPRWPDLFVNVGRGAGKNGYLSFEDFCLISPYHGIPRYDIDICANSEDQARTSFDDVYDILETNQKKLKRFFWWNKERIVCLQTGSTLRFRTSNARTKDGGRPGKVDFDEVHEYENYAMIDVFVTGFGKKKHPRTTYITTNGNVRDGVLDDMLSRAKSVLFGGEADAGTLYFICKLDEYEEVHDEKNWHKANPSLRYLPDLYAEIIKEYQVFKESGKLTGAFMTKRMNYPRAETETAVTSWENLMAASRPVPDMSGRIGVVGIDYAKITDFVSAGILVRDADMRYWIDHTWVCRQSADLGRIKAPLDEWAAQGLLTWIDDVEIPPTVVTEWVSEQAEKYGIKIIALDDFRYALMAAALRGIGFDAKEHKNVKLIRPSDKIRVYPVIDSVFKNQKIVWGDQTMMRWYTNNTKVVQAAKRRVKDAADVGNYEFSKIEPKSRKTDGFFALVAAMCVENEIENAAANIEQLMTLPPLIF